MIYNVMFQGNYTLFTVEAKDNKEARNVANKMISVKKYKYRDKRI